MVLNSRLISVDSFNSSLNFTPSIFEARVRFFKGSSASLNSYTSDLKFSDGVPSSKK